MKTPPPSPPPTFKGAFKNLSEKKENKFNSEIEIIGTLKRYPPPTNTD